MVMEPVPPWIVPAQLVRSKALNPPPVVTLVKAILVETPLPLLMSIPPPLGLLMLTYVYGALCFICFGIVVLAIALKPSLLDIQVRGEDFIAVIIPFVTIIMTVLAVPFAVTTGRRGAMYGVGVGIVLAITYWIAMSITGALGAGGVMPPALAAWAPNLVFGSAAAYLVLTVRT